MATRISELPPGTPPYAGATLIEVAVPDGASPSGFVSRSAALSNLLGGSTGGVSGQSLVNPNGLIVPYYLDPGSDPYADTNVQRLLDAMRAYHDVPVLIIINPSNGPGTGTLAKYTTLIKLLQAAGGTVLGYVPTTFGTRPEGQIQIDVNHWLSYYPRINGIFYDEMPWDVGPGNVGSAYVDLYKRLTDYAHSLGLSPTVGNPGTNQQPMWFSVYTADIIVVHEDLSWPTESSMEGNYSNGHTDYNYARRAGLVYNQSTLDPINFAMLRRYVQWLYVTNDNLTGGELNPWDTLPAYLEQMFGLLGSGVAGSAPPASATAAGTTGTVTWDANYVYVCVATDTWKRAALSSW